jgi:hypothetical protein
MIAFKDERTGDLVAQANITHTSHNLQAIPEKIRSACCVCMLEDRIKKNFRRDDRFGLLGTLVETIKKRSGCLAPEI